MVIEIGEAIVKSIQKQQEITDHCSHRKSLSFRKTWSDLKAAHVY
jgi:hypothetical protein